MKAKEKKRVLVVDDHPMVREMLAHLIAQEPDLAVCGSADNIHQAMQLIQEERPDIAIVDITLKGSSGLELIKNLKAQQLEVPVLILSMHDEALYAERAFRAGARGYITKSEDSEAVMAAIRQVLAGDIYASPNFTSQLLKNLTETGKPKKGSLLSELTDRELEVFHLIGQGRTTQDIAMSLNLGSKTVDTYRTRIKEKLGLRNAAELHHRAVHWVKDLELRLPEVESGRPAPGG
jgi:DNA-binding NarL/FixJ family response regulator